MPVDGCGTMVTGQWVALDSGGWFPLADDWPGYYTEGLFAAIRFPSALFQAVNMQNRSSQVEV